MGSESFVISEMRIVKITPTPFSAVSCAIFLTDLLLDSLRPRGAASANMAAASQDIERRIILRTRLADGYDLTNIGLKHLQHVFTVWFPQAVFDDLTDDTVRVDVVVRKGQASGRSVYNASFVTADGSVIKITDYDEDRITGRVSKSYDLKRSVYFGNKDGFDYRNLFYLKRPTTKSR